MNFSTNHKLVDKFKEFQSLLRDQTIVVIRQKLQFKLGLGLCDGPDLI